MQIYAVRKQPEPFYCAFRNRETYYPFNTLDAKMCERQCIKCECYQEGSSDFNPRHLPVIIREYDYCMRLPDLTVVLMCVERGVYDHNPVDYDYEDDRF